MREHLMHSHPYTLAQTRRRSPAHLAGLLLLILIVVACSGPTTQEPAKQSQTAGPPSSGFTAFKLGLPADALSAPVKGPLPDSTPLHVGITFKTNQAVLDKLKKSKQSSNLEESGKDLG